MAGHQGAVRGRQGARLTTLWQAGPQSRRIWSSRRDAQDARERARPPEGGRPLHNQYVNITPETRRAPWRRPDGPISAKSGRPFVRLGGGGGEPCCGPSPSRHVLMHCRPHLSSTVRGAHIRPTECFMAAAKAEY